MRVRALFVGGIIILLSFAAAFLFGCSGQVVDNSVVTTTTTTTSTTTTTLVGTLYLQITGEANSDHFGFSVSRAGTKLIVGAPEANPSGKTDAGAVYVYSSAGTLSYPLLAGAAAGDRFGYSVAGSSEAVIVGAYRADPNGKADAGKVYVYTLDGNERFLVNGQTVDDELGYSVSDFGGNFLAGASYSGTFPTGKAFLFSGTDASILFVATGEAVDSGFGRSVANAGDVDGSGADDLIIGAPLFDNGGAQTVDKGTAYVYLGEGTHSLKYQKLGEANGDGFGISVAGLGQVFETGFSDFLVGAYKAGTGGKAYAYRGRNGELLYAVSGEASSDDFGRSVANAGDINGDGKNDFIVGAPGANKAYVYNGVNGALLYLVTGEAGSQFGFAVSGAGDINGDGLADIMVGAPFADPPGSLDAGKVYVYVTQ